MPRTRPLLPLSRFRTFAEGLDHPEGLAFDRDGNCWAGGELGQIYRMDRRGRVREVACLGGFHLGLTFSRENELWICNLKRGALLRVSRSGRVLDSIERVGARPLRAPNFSVFDSEGNLYFSDSGHWDRPSGWIYRRRRNGRCEVFAGPLAFPNGLALDAAERWLYVARSTRDDILRIAIRADGRPGRAEVFACGLARVPDGLAFDSRGNLYVSCYASDTMYRVSPAGRVVLLACDPTGTMLARPTNLAFGGPGFDQIYVANLGRWHICRAPAGVCGQPLAHQR